MAAFDSSDSWAGDVRLVAMSSSGDGEPLVTLEFSRTPRSGWLGELARHRCASLSVESARAVPLNLVLQQIMGDPYIPMDMRVNGRGMESQIQMDGKTLKQAQTHWLKCRDSVVRHAADLVSLGGHKQDVSRLLEPWVRIRLVLSTTSLASILLLRMAPDVQPVFQHIARRMGACVKGVTPRILGEDEWHAPYCDTDGTVSHEQMIQCVARCARATYGRNGDVKTLAEDASLVLRLMNADVPREYPCVGWDAESHGYIDTRASTAQCVHASPFEHVARFRPNAPVYMRDSGNFSSNWAQLRHCRYTLDAMVSRAREIHRAANDTGGAGDA